jgi:hypothetical protein
MTEKDFKFVDPKMQEYVEINRESIAAAMGVPKEEVNCKGLRIFFVHEPTGTMCSQGMFVDNFSPEDYND